jgi:hypothetical protein
VLVSVMIELLTASSALNRVVVVNAFRLIAPMIPERGVKDIVDAIVATENEDVNEEEEKESGGDDDDDVDNNVENAFADEEFEDIPAGELLPDIRFSEKEKFCEKCLMFFFCFFSKIGRCGSRVFESC